jgi:GNAT superfamily N-acetyltransferase
MIGKGENPMIQIHELERSHLEHLLPLLEAYIREIGEGSLAEGSAGRIGEAIDNGKISFFVAEEDGALVGMCSLSIAFSTYGGGRPWGIFEDFYIAPERRQEGIASKLVTYVFREAAKRGCSSVTVGSSKGDVPMYRHLGFNVHLGHMLSRDVG